jgi:hypothetical protein
MKRLILLSLLATTLGCTKKVAIEGPYVKVAVLGDLYGGDWIEINDYRIEFMIPDTTKAVPNNLSYNPHYLEVDKSDTKLGFVSPSLTYQIGPNKAVEKHVVKGEMLYNIARMMTILSYTEHDSSVFDFKTDKIAAFNGLLIVGMNTNEPIKIAYPETMNLSVEPYTPKN